MGMETNREITLDQADLRASRAFIEQDYKAVIYWLRPHLNKLCPKNRKKLRISIERFTEEFSALGLSQNLMSSLDTGMTADEAIRASEIEKQVSALKNFARDPYEKGIGMHIKLPPTSVVSGDEVLDLTKSVFEECPYDFPVRYFIYDIAEITEITLYIRDRAYNVDLQNLSDELKHYANLREGLWSS